MTQTDNTPRVGQIWIDNDKRVFLRKIRIVEILEDTVRAEIIQHVESPRMVGRIVTIKLSRMKPTATGYRLLPDVS